jgi:EAL domain-containing protein (putative c-di-GMP-specific phosphodiesterase class I)
LEEKNIIPVYQPIVSLIDGQIFGYEAFTKIFDKTPGLNIGHIFKFAEKMNKLWELEALCRKKSLKNAKNIDPDKKLFLNVNPNTIHDPEFKNGFTKDYLLKYGLDFLDIVFEITERNVIMDKEAFLESIEYYRKQKFKISIDDVGSGYSGLNTINDIRPDIIKLDMSLIKDIDKDEVKKHLCKAIISFGKNTGTKIIAEGIENREELKTLIKINAEFGQGYFLGMPKEKFEDIAPEKKELIKKYQEKKLKTAKVKHTAKS